MSVSLIDGHIDDDVMTDEQIIKALEYCVEKGYCTDCPYNESFSDCKVEYDILDLINRQKEKIERSEEEICRYKRTMSGLVSFYKFLANFEGIYTDRIARYAFEKAEKYTEEMVGEG